MEAIGSRRFIPSITASLVSIMPWLRLAMKCKKIIGNSRMEVALILLLIWPMNRTLEMLSLLKLIVYVAYLLLSSILVARITIPLIVIRRLLFLALTASYFPLRKVVGAGPFSQYRYGKLIMKFLPKMRKLLIFQNPVQGGARQAING